mmetsp:Transcript_36978/g.93385  ORF Transcript_36978/g.93385 Transcript_36978/m.93385 type:complete len:214 (-) Transcript_36978:1745-2386(-)
MSAPAAARRSAQPGTAPPPAPPSARPPRAGQARCRPQGAVQTPPRWAPAAAAALGAARHAAASPASGRPPAGSKTPADWCRQGGNQKAAGPPATPPGGACPPPAPAPAHRSRPAAQQQRCLGLQHVAGSGARHRHCWNHRCVARLTTAPAAVLQPGVVHPHQRVHHGAQAQPRVSGPHACGREAAGHGELRDAAREGGASVAVRQVAAGIPGR